MDDEGGQVEISFFFGLSFGYFFRGPIKTSPAATLIQEVQGKTVLGLTELFALLKPHLEDTLQVTVLFCVTQLG